jgi:putative methylase
MKKKDLELFLSTIPDFTYPKPDLEQYKTPSAIAADMLFLAYGCHDIQGKDVLDLGCGTGIFSFGSEYLHASHVLGVDKGKDCIKQAISYKKKHQSQVDFLCKDISTVSTEVDTVIMNPPFGAQKANIHADRFFIEKATGLASVVYSLHLEHTLDFISSLLRSLDKQGSVIKVYQFPMKAQFQFHMKMKENISVAFLQIK